MRTHWPPRRTARRARPQAAEPSGGSVRPPTRPLCPAPACARRAPRSLRWARRSRFPARVTPPGARGGCGALGSPWWQRVPGARASPAARAEVPAERGPLTAPWPLPGPCPPARPLRPQLSMAQPPSLDHAQKLSKVDLLRVSLLWRPLREARVSILVGGGGRRGAGSPESLLQRTWGPELWGGRAFLGATGVSGPRLSLADSSEPRNPEVLPRGAEPRTQQEQRGPRTAAAGLAGSGERAGRVLSPVWAPGPGGGTRLPSPGLRWAPSPGRALAARRARRAEGRGASRAGEIGACTRRERAGPAPSVALRLYPSPGHVEITLTTRPAGSGWAAGPARQPRAPSGARAPARLGPCARPPLAALPLARPGGRAPGGPRSLLAAVAAPSRISTFLNLAESLPVEPRSPLDGICLGLPRLGVEGQCDRTGRSAPRRR